MRNMKGIVAWILGLALLLGLGAAAGESALPEIPVFEGTLEIGPVTNEEEAIAAAKAFLALDYVGVNAANATYTVAEHWVEGCLQVVANIEDYGFIEVAFDPDGNVVFMEDAACGFYYIVEAAESEEEAEDAAADDGDDSEEVAWRETLDRRMEYPFLAEVNPKVYEQYTAEYPLDEGNNEFLAHYYNTYTDTDGVYQAGAVFDLYYSEYYDNETYRIKIGIQTRPVLRIVYFDVFCDPEEGGNG